MGEQRNNRATSPHKQALLAAAIIVGSSLCGPVIPVAASNDVAPPSGPHVLDGPIAEVLVRVHGGGSCTGTPITGTRFVVTAAHCVLDRNGDLGVRTVARDEDVYTAQAVLVDTRYHETQTAEFDAAVLVMDRVVAGPSATIGSALPTSGSLTLAGYQAIDTDGTLLRGTTSHDRPLPKGATGNLIRIASAPAGCTEDVSTLEIAADVVKVHCGLIPGASGGGLFSDVCGLPVLVGIVSNVSADISENGAVPISSLRQLLENPGRYLHDLPEHGAELRTANARILLS